MGGGKVTATFYVGDAVTVMNTLPEKSVDLILTSPPFLALRSYLPSDHPDKALEGGSQATPGAYIDWLLEVVEACARVLASHGSLCFELGDTYSGSVHSGDQMGNDRYPNGRGVATGSSFRGRGWALPKSLSLIPETFRFAMVYGHNPHTGRQCDTWRLRNVIRWVRPNPPVGALGDKFRPATSELMVFCKAKDRFFDLDAVRGEVSEWTQGYANREVPASERWHTEPDGTRRMIRNTTLNQQGAPPLDWWNIPPGGYPGAHYAVWPPELLVKPIKAMCPESVCRVCGEARRRIVGEATYPGSVKDGAQADGVFMRGGKSVAGLTVGSNAGLTRVAPTIGWTDCGHSCEKCGGTGKVKEWRLDSGLPRGGVSGYQGREWDIRCPDCSGVSAWRPGLVLDPFAGSGTTLAVATGHGRDAIGIDLDERNYELALDRVGPLVLTRAA